MSGKTEVIDKRVVHCEIHCGKPSFLAYSDGSVRVYANEDRIDARLKLGDTKYVVIETAEEFKAKCALCGPDEYEGGEFLVRLTAAKKAFPEYEYNGSSSE